MKAHGGILIGRLGPAQNIAPPERATHRAGWQVHQLTMQTERAAIGNFLSGDIQTEIPPGDDSGGRHGGGLYGGCRIERAVQQQRMLEPPVEMIAADRACSHRRHEHDGGGIHYCRELGFAAAADTPIPPKRDLQ